MSLIRNMRSEIALLKIYLHFPCANELREYIDRKIKSQTLWKPLGMNLHIDISQAFSKWIL